MEGLCRLRGEECVIFKYDWESMGWLRWKEWLDLTYW